MRARPPPLLHGDQDRTVPYGASVGMFADAMPPKFFERLIGAPHTPFRSPWLDPIVKSVTDFLDAYLKNDHRALAQLAVDATVPASQASNNSPDGPNLTDREQRRQPVMDQ